MRRSTSVALCVTMCAALAFSQGPPSQGAPQSKVESKAPVEEPELKALDRLRHVKSWCFSVVLEVCDTVMPKEKTERDSSKATALEAPKDPEGVIQRAQALERAGEIEAAGDLYELYLRFFPKGRHAKEAKRGLSWIIPHLQMRSYDPGPELAARSIEAGDYYLEEGNLKSAIGHYRRALEQYPSSTVATFRLAQALEKTGAIDEARERYARYLQLRPAGRFAPACQEALERLAIPEAATSPPAQTPR